MSLNGVDTVTLFATLDAVKAARSRASSSSAPTTSGSAVPTTGAPSTGTSVSARNASRTSDFVFDADHPAVLVGRDNGPTPVEFVLHALAACLTAGLANIAAARGVRLTEVRSTVEGDIDLNGILGLDPAVRNGYQQHRAVHDQGGRPGGSCAGSSSSPRTLGGVRHRHQGRTGHHRRRGL